MVELNKCNKLIDLGYSIITVGKDKMPNYAWKKYQTEQITKQVFENHYNYKGGYITKSGIEMQATENVGIVTGFGDLEVIDIDLKVFSTAKEQKDFWDEYINLLEDNILDFKEKFVIYKTINNGYHILYKSKRAVGNSKIAKLKDHKECIIETRGIGGYVFFYDGKNQTDLTYNDVSYISDEDRDILWSCSRLYDFVEYEEIIIPAKEKKEYQTTDNLTPWQDYNEKTSIIDFIAEDLKVVGNLKDKYIIKRHGAKSAHSGYVYKNSNCMFLFTTATIYDNEKLYSPFSAYAKKYHNDNFSEATKDLYSKGYGDRIKPKPLEKKEKIIIPEADLVFPIDIFPYSLQKYISECSKTLNNSIDYMGSSMLFVISIIIGNSRVVQVKRGWNESPNVWLSLVGRAGVGKTPSINSITFPLEKLNNKEIKKFFKNQEKFDIYNSLDKKEKEVTELVEKPRKTQFIVNDITLEALVELHGENKNGIGVNKDELAGWMLDMNKYRSGSDMQHWLSSWSGQQINLNRKTARSSFVQKAFIPVLGGIQPSIMDTFYTDENKDSGFIDRMLFCFPELTPLNYSEREMEQELLYWYNDYIVSFYEMIKRELKYTDDGEIEPLIVRFSDDAKVEWIRIHDTIIAKQISDDENEYMKSMYPKQISYIPRFALLINSLSALDNIDIQRHIITKDSVLKAEKLSNYFINMAKKIKGQSTERSDMNTTISNLKGKSSYDKCIAIYVSDNEVNRTQLADKLGVSRRTILNYIKKFEENKK